MLDSILSKKLLVDTNLLVLFVVGSVNPNRIEAFKRTRAYTKMDFQLLRRILGNFDSLYTVAHVMAEVSNLSDLEGAEMLKARGILKEVVSLLTEADMPSKTAAADPFYEKLGLVDAAIGAVARLHACTVLTDDFNLYQRLNRDGVSSINFAHLREQNWGV